MPSGFARIALTPDFVPNCSGFQRSANLQVTGQLPTHVTPVPLTSVKCAHLRISQLRECVDDDTEDDVETNGGDEDEEDQVKGRDG